MHLQDNMFSLLGRVLGMTRLDFLAVAALIMIPTVWLPNVSYLSFLGVFGVAATLSVTASVSFMEQTIAGAALIMIPTVWLPNMSYLSFLDVFGAAVMLSVTASVGSTE